MIFRIITYICFSNRSTHRLEVGAGGDDAAHGGQVSRAHRLTERRHLRHVAVADSSCSRGAGAAAQRSRAEAALLVTVCD